MNEFIDSMPQYLGTPILEKIYTAAEILGVLLVFHIVLLIISITAYLSIHFIIKAVKEVKK